MSTISRARTRRAARAVPAAAVGVLLLASCGHGASAGAAAGAPVANAAAVAVSVPATATGARGDRNVEALATRVSTSLEGVRSGTATVSVAGQGGPAGSVTITADAAAPAARITADVAGQTYEVRALGGAVYASGPALQALTGGRAWARVDVATLAQLVGGVATPSTGPSAVPDPAKVGGLVARAVSVRDLGAATVHGITGHSYRLSVPVAAIAQLTAGTGLPLDAGQRSQLRQGVDALARQGVPVLSADLTLDGRDRPLQLTTATPALAGGIAPVRVTVAFSSWGAPLKVTAPPAAQVTVLDARALTALAGKLEPMVMSSGPSDAR